MKKHLKKLVKVFTIILLLMIFTYNAYTFINIKNNEAYILNMYIAKYEEGNIFNHEERRTRKLLLHKKEIKKLKEQIKIEGLTIIPLKLYFKKNKVKILIGVCKGKKLYDKRASLKEKDLKREARYY